MAKIYTYSNKGITGYNGKELIKLPYTLKSGELSTETRHVFLIIMNSVPFKTLDDSIQGTRLADAIDEAEGKNTIEIGEGVYDWLIKKMNEKTQDGSEVCPTVFRVNGKVVYDFIKEGFNKPHEPAAKEKGKKEKDASPAEESGQEE